MKTLKLPQLLALAAVIASTALVLAPTLAQATEDTVQLTQAGTGDQLYQEFGGRDGIQKLVLEFAGIVTTDPRIAHFFQHIDANRLVGELTDQFSYATGGPYQYTGRSMTDTHKHLGITRVDYNALVEDLQLALDRRNIPYHDQNKFLAVFAPMYHDIEQPKVVN